MAILSNNMKLLSCIFGHILFHLGTGPLFPLGNLSVYVVSYHRAKLNLEWLTVDYGFFFLPILMFSLSLSVSFGGYIDAQLGIHL